MIKDIAFVAYSVRDVPRARDFYRDTLGLTPGDAFGDHWVEFNVGNTTFGIGNGESLGFEPGEIFEFPACSSCFARDPEGNRFALHQRRPSSHETAT